MSREAREAAAALRGTETRSADTLSRIDALTARRHRLDAELAHDSAILATMLPLMLRLSLYPAETLLAAPGAPADTLSALMVLRGLGTQLEAGAEHVRAERRTLDRIADALGRENRSLASLEQTQAEQDRRIEDEVRRAAALQRPPADAPAVRTAAMHAAAASSLRGAIGRLAAAPVAVEAPSLRNSRSRGVEEAPVAGPLVQGWGARTDAGPAIGLTYAPPALALVAAPCDGQVDFAGPFRSYGHMLILDCGHDIRFVLAGMQRLDVAVGQTLRKGTPVGRMPDWHATEAAGRPSLYVQLRRGSEAIDPTGFLRGRS